MHIENYLKRPVFKYPLFILLFLITQTGFSQKPQLMRDYSFVMEIPGIMDMESSATHLYVLSKAEGLAVFRTRPDTLQWLYTSPGMNKRGDNLSADIRFAYLYGNQKRFSVIEPTSVVGVFSSTNLPIPAKGVHRLGSELYLALDSLGLGQLSLTSPSSFDSTVTFVDAKRWQNARILDLTGTPREMIVATDQPSLAWYNIEGGNINFQQRIDTDNTFSYIFTRKGLLYGASDNGDIHIINRDGKQENIGSIGEPVLKIRPWKDWIIIRGKSGRIWTSYQKEEPKLWKDNGDAGNYFTVNKKQFWLNEYNKIARIQQVDPLAESRQDTLGLFTDIVSLNLKSIKNRIVSLPHPVLVPVELSEEYPVEAIQYTYESPTIEDAFIRKQGFYWEPGSNDVGRHQVTIIATASSGATDSVQFEIDVKSFNAPPRFTPLRTVTVPVGEKYTLPIQAFDPDGTYPELIRYLGMNLPEGSQLDEKTGEFQWTPTQDQIGTHSFKVIATDQFGAASSQKVTLQVIKRPSRE